MLRVLFVMYRLATPVVINMCETNENMLCSVYMLAFVAPSTPRYGEEKEIIFRGVHVLGLRVTDVPRDDRKAEMRARGEGSNSGGASGYHGLCW